MWNGRDVSFIIILAVFSFVYTVIVGQLGNLITGLLGMNYFFIIGHAFFISFGFLIYEGRRWRFLMQTFLVALLTLPTYQSGAPYDVLGRIPMIINSFFIDLIFNSFYAFFRKKDRLLWWSIFVALGFILLIPLFVSMNMILFYPPEVVISYISIYVLLFPVTIIETVSGGYLAKKLLDRVIKEKILN
jgi:hypothetical protein